MFATSKQCSTRTTKQTRPYLKKSKQNLNRLAASLVPLLLVGCASTVNTAGSGEYACPGMPVGVTCKTPSAVYKSTNADPEITDFDTPIGSQSVGSRAAVGVAQASSAQTVSGLIPQVLARPTPGPKPVREPAKVVRIWVAPWVDKNDNLHLAQIHYTEVTPRTWSVGKSEITAGRGYVIPHIAFFGIGSDPQAGESPNSQPVINPVNAASPSRQNDGFPALPGQ